ncbi:MULTISPECIES: TcdA/TcdB pore-forming domain-containing protein [unclassified Pseudomonas]|uniref:TcdA/TcdB pore-forming domain-containing protein n=1 Tax=unclassified Pseudomonas TaxID=196821 RepID=UPI002AC9947C|nr:MULTISPECIES: TcdA/TcdB pore-forming domain-containing protein [unclassified Pseudomonas]MEB0046512.1 TcdA/TcdB pore-forming domain-containing protein [Pseudomonas sp. Dout3]MEB0097938.1 TcdA/TcdB pore-forming domain-containing protein [Pseudomonas sp. DC1.2]WPX59565.1 TcdA/TcdB pore-forming domain-containing protein [Pseudomonas sp. DC1.2]
MSFSTSEGQRFVSVVDFPEIINFFHDYRETLEFMELERAYHAASATALSAEQVAPVSLFKERFNSLLSKKNKPVPTAVTRSYGNVIAYLANVEKTAEIFSGNASEVPRVMHFVWVGGSEVGAIQRDYIHLWQQVMAEQGHAFNLWYDSDALLAFEMNRVIIESAKAHAMASGGAEATSPQQLALMIEDRALVLKQQMFAYLQQPQWVGRADDARIDLMVRAYGKDQVTLTTFRQNCVNSHLAMVGPALRLRDVRDTFNAHFLWDVYEREISFRGNFAAASDVVRLQALALEGGTYSDVDYLPPLAQRLGGVDVVAFDTYAQLGVLQLLLDHNKHLMPGRNEARYGDSRSSIPAEHRDALLKFAQASPGVLDIFTAPADRRSPIDGLRLTSNDMNAHMIAHPQAGMTLSVMEAVRFYYDCLIEVERRVTTSGVAWSDINKMVDVATVVFDLRFAELPFTSTFRQQQYRAKVIGAIVSYHSDGLRYGARATIDLTGPGAAVSGIAEYVERHLVGVSAQSVRDTLKLKAGYNASTEEELIHSWTENVDDPNAWLMKEQSNWAAGKYTARYAHSLPELLKGNVLTFKQGWPVIEGRPVLLTGVLQSLLDALGEPFIRAMNDKLNGDVMFDRPLPIGPAERALIIAQAATELPASVGAQPIGYLNEVFTRIDHGSLPLEQLSPLQRVLLGGIFEAQTLDDTGFAAAWESVLTMARATADRGMVARFAFICERVLQKSRGGSVLLPDQDGVSGSAELKVRALVEPLSVRQWQAYAERVRAVSLREFRSLILYAAGEVRQSFHKSGASSARQLPQQLLVSGEGEPGRRCYPLVLVMAAAVTEGPLAERALIGNMAIANGAPETQHAGVLLLTLDELRSIPMAEFGDKRGETGLIEVMKILEEKTTTSTLMLNTENHSLLVAKVWVDDRYAYRFYDPNFGIYAFDQLPQMQGAMLDFLSTFKLAPLYAIKDPEHPVFNVIELDGSKIARKILPSHLSVQSLLHHQMIVEGLPVDTWKHHATQRTRALSENARLGACASQLDGVYWANQIHRIGTELLKVPQAEGKNFAPLFDTAKPLADGRYEVSLVNLDDPQTQIKVYTKDWRIIRVRDFLSKRFEALLRPHSNEPGANTLNVAFAMQALLGHLRELDHNRQSEQESSLTVAIRLRGYVNNAQLVHGVVVDAVQLVRLVRQVRTSERAIVAAASVGHLLERTATTGAGRFFSAVGVGFDIYELANAENEEQSARAATQLAFDLGGLALEGFGAVVGGTAGAFAAALAVPLLGVGFGVSAIAGNLGRIKDQAKGIAETFNQFSGAYSSQAYTRTKGIVSILPLSVVETLDLQNDRIEFGSQWLYRSHRPNFHLPEPDGNKARAINIRQSLALPRQVNLPPFAAQRDSESGELFTPGLLLPCTPTCYYGYGYHLGSDSQPLAYDPPKMLLSGLLPLGLFLPERKDPVFETLKKLEFDAQGQRQFYLTASNPFPYIVYKLHPIYVATTVTVRADERTRLFHVPDIPDAWQGHISYRIETHGERCTLVLNPGVVDIELSTCELVDKSSWVLIADWVAPPEVSVEVQTLTVAGIAIRFVDKAEVYLQLKDKQVYTVEWASGRLLLAQLDVIDDQQFEQKRLHLQTLARQHQLSSPYTAVLNFPLPYTHGNQPVHTTAWYDRAHERFIYGRDLPGSVAKSIQLGAVVAGQAFLYDPSHATIWRVDVRNGLVTRRYHVANPANATSTLTCEDLGAGILQIEQKLKIKGVPTFHLVYRLSADRLTLCAITGAPASGATSGYFERLVHEGLASIFEHLEPRARYNDQTPGVSQWVSSWLPATFVSVRTRPGQFPAFVVWVRSGDGLLIQPGSRSFTDVVDRGALVLLEPDALHSRNSFVFYDATNKALYLHRQAVNLAAGSNAPGPAALLEKLALPGPVTVVKHQNVYLASTSEGLTFAVSDDGSFQLISVDACWLQNHTEWSQALAALGDQYAGSRFSVSGLLNDKGTSSLHAWWVGGRLLIADLGAKRDVRLLGPTPDQQSAWLFEPSRGQLYRQDFLSTEQLSAVLGNSRQLLRANVLAPVRREWADWVFSEVSVSAGGLKARSVDHVHLQLVDLQPARIVGVALEWVQARTHQSATLEPLRKPLRDLLSQHAHAAHVAVFSWARHQWYVVETEHFIAMDKTLLNEPVAVLGARNETDALVQDLTRHVLCSSPQRERFGPFDYLACDGPVLMLMLKPKQVIDDLLPLIPDGVTTLMLGGLSGAACCWIKPLAWAKFDSIVVSCTERLGTEAPGELVVQVGVQDTWRVDLQHGHLLISDPDTGHSLIFRNAHDELIARSPMSLTLMVFGDWLTVSIDDLVQAMRVDKQGGPELGLLIEQMNEVSLRPRAAMH